MKILLVDDEVSFLEQAEIFLTNEEEGFVIDTSPSAKDAMSKLEENRYDAIISDYQMPNIDGLEFLEIIREEKGLEIPFVIFTGKGREEVAIKALNIGADRYIQKGGDPKSQYGVLAQAVKQEIKHYMESKKRKEVEAKLSSLVEASEDPIYIVDRDCNILFANKAELEKTGMRLDEIVNSSFIESHPESDAIEFRERVNDVLKTGEPKVHEVKHEKNGKYYYRTLSPIKNPSTDEIDRIAVISKDISDRKKMEDDLKESEEKYRKLVETTGDLIFIHDEKGNIKFVNNAGLEFSGYTEDEVMGKNIMEFLPENELETLLERKKKRIEEGNQDRQNFETAFINKDGERMEVDIQSTPLIENGEFNGELVVARDITERKEKEEKLAIAEKKYKTLFEELSDAIFLEDKEGNILEVNDEVCDLLGYIEEELTDMSVDDLVPEGQGKLLPGEIDEATLNGKPLETINLSKDGKRIPVEVRGKLIELQGKERLLVSLRDVSERKNKEEELKEARARMSTLLSTIPSYVYMKDHDLNFVTANESLCNMLGVSKEEINGKDDYDFFPEKHAKEYKRDDRRVVETGEPVTNRIERVPDDNGDITWNLTNKRPIKDEDGNVIGLVGQTMDITERIETERELEKREKELRTVTSGTNDAIIMIDSKDRVQFWNEGAEDMFGYTEEEAKEKRSHEMIAPEKYKDQYEKGMKKFRATSNGNVLGDTIEVEAEKRDGSTFPVELSISSLEMNDELHAVAVIRDITKRKKAEEREDFLHSLLRHDVANKNRVVQGYLELLKEYDLPDEVVKLVKNSEIAIEKSIKLIEKVRILREAQNEEIKEVDISSIIKNTVSQIRPMIKEAGMEIEKECPEDTIMVKGGPLIDNVFSNIIENSIKHSDGSKLRIHAEITQDEVICILEDDGKGIPEEDESYIFEKGYTTDEERGTGLGLFLVKMLLEIYDGEIEVKKSELGGPRFDIHLKRK